MIKRSTFIAMLGICLTVPGMGQSKEDAQALVKKAIEFSKANGTYKLIQAVNRQDPEFRQGELYIWMVDL